MEENGEKSRSLLIASIYLLAFIAGVVILFTDNNLKTDFGSVRPYFIHWYIFAALDIVTLVVAIYLFLTRSIRGSSKLGIIWSSIMMVIMAGDTLTYSSVGFSSPVQFGEYLFGLTTYPESLPYIPGLYTLLFLLFLTDLIISLYYLKKSPEVNNSI